MVDCFVFSLLMHSSCLSAISAVDHGESLAQLHREWWVTILGGVKNSGDVAFNGGYGHWVWWGWVGLGICEVCSNFVILSWQSHCFQCHIMLVTQPHSTQHTGMKAQASRHQGEQAAPNPGVCFQTSQAWNLWAPLGGKTCQDPS